MAGLLHDIGFVVNCITFPTEFAAAVLEATRLQIPLLDAEKATMGFTHCDTGRALAEKWHLSEDMLQVIAHHHDLDAAESALPLVALVHLSDVLCRVRGMGYGYYESHRTDLMADSAWPILLKEYSGLGDIDIARFSFEMDDAVGEIIELVSTIFGGSKAAAG
jgi:hypothetical protein